MNYIRLEELEPGALFTTKKGTVAVKSEYRMPSGQCMCILVASGEYAHFERGNDTPVRELRWREEEEYSDE